MVRMLHRKWSAISRLVFQILPAPAVSIVFISFIRFYVWLDFSGVSHGVNILINFRKRLLVQFAPGNALDESYPLYLSNMRILQLNCHLRNSLLLLLSTGFTR